MWDGLERRVNPYCKDHLCIASDLAVIKTTLINLDKRINGSLDAIQKHIDEGKGWRSTIVGILATVIIQIVIFANLYGSLSERVEVNTEKWSRLENVKVQEPRVR